MPHHDVNTEPFVMADDVALWNLRHLSGRLYYYRADAILTRRLNRGFSKCEKDGYGNEVPRLARPLPVEYLLVDVPASTPLSPLFTFYADVNTRPFPVENRMVDGHIQDFSALSSYMQQFTPDCFLQAVSDFHFLLYISAMDMLPLKDYMGPILEAVRTQNSEQAQDWSHSEHWATVEQLIAVSLSSPPQSRPQSVAFAEVGTVSGGTDNSENGLVRGSDHSVTSQADPDSLWTCPHCTYLNSAELGTCEMCSLPRQGSRLSHL